MSTRPAADDYDEIVALTVRYCWALDDRRFDELKTIFTEEARCDYGAPTPFVGPEKLGEFFAGVVAGMKVQASQHVVLNHDIHVDGDTATCRCQYQSHYALPATSGASPVMDTGGVYHDELVRTADGWRIASRTASRTWALGEPTA